MRVSEVRSRSLPRAAAAAVFLAGCLFSLGGAAGPAAAITFRYLAFGDSITAGSYPSKLSSKLGCNGTNCLFVNEGLPGEQTSSMVTRLQNLVGWYDVAIIMGGTNDIFHGVSNNTIENNYKSLDNVAVSRNWDPVLASIIHFREDLPSAAPRNVQAADFGSRVETIATNRNRYFVDTFPALCPDTACFLTHYQYAWPDPVGHPDDSGDNILANLFRDEINQESPPPTPTAWSPTGTIGDTTPTLTWTEVARANWYFVELDGTNAHPDVVDWIPLADSNCSAGVCSFTVPDPLAPGAHSFRILARNPKGFSPAFSALVHFTVSAVAPPAQTYPLNGAETFDTTPLLRWNEVSGATDYKIEIFDAGHNQIVWQSYSAASVCANGSCEVSSPAALATQAHSWRARAWNAVHGDGPWSGEQSFTVLACSAPPAKSLAAATITGLLVTKACDSITAGSGGYVVQGSAGNLTFHAGNKVVLENGFQVGTGATFTAITDPQ